MKILRKYIKPIAALLFLNTVYYIAAPSVAMALTAGPTAPEYSSFEPFDTTDMVNLATGDLAYNIPLLEVPGPTGGYPLSLSYHAGISPGLEASWVGLGWTLNAGAINRTVSGFADDYNNVSQTDRYFWEGGKTISYTLGVSYGVANSATASASLTYANDTYQGVGVGYSFSYGASANIGSGTSLGYSTSFSRSPFGSLRVNSGFNLGVGQSVSKSIRASSSLGVNFGENGLSAGFSNGIRKGSNSLLGTSLSTSQAKSANLSVGGGSFKALNNSKSGDISTKGFSFNVDIPTPVPGLNVRLGHSYQRYWIDQATISNTNGSLYNPNGQQLGRLVSGSNQEPLVNYENSSFDTYENVDLVDKVIGNYNTELRNNNGSYADYDQYSVNAQGIGGAIQPSQYQTFLYRQSFNRNDVYNRNYSNRRGSNVPPAIRDYSFTNYFLGANENKPQFRFKGDFSNKLIDTQFKFGYDPNQQLPLFIEGEEEYLTGENDNDGIIDGKLFGSKNIEWFTNREIIDGDAATLGFIDTPVNGFERKYDAKIGGFLITNESGVTYHFSLPVYAFDEYILSKNTNREGDNFNQITKKEPYAYTWLLTSVTGPDYVDRNISGLDEGDWGYWVKFDYGKWSSEYNWRNPGEGVNPDLDNEFETFAKGKKEIYFLDAIKTTSHTAIFVKDIRLDGKGTTELIEEGASTNDDDHRVNFFDEGGYIPKELFNENGISIGYDFPDPSLKLSSILLFKNEDLLNNLGDPIFNKRTGDKELPTSYEYSIEGSSTTRSIYFPNEDNVYTSNDIEEIDKANALREIAFSQDYSLMKGTPNSFSNSFYQNKTPLTSELAYRREGKLTLNSITYNGKGASASLIPPMKFFYDLENAVTGVGTLTYAPGNFGFLEVPLNEDQPKIGDIIQTEVDGFRYTGKVVHDGGISEVTPGIIVYTLHTMIDHEMPFQSAEIIWYTTKNPDYREKSTDIWGAFKDEYKEIPHRSGINYNATKMTTAQSAQNTDAWSLKRIETSLGSTIKIELESDDYNNSILNKNNAIIINDFYNNENNQYTFDIESFSMDPTELYQVGDEIDLYFAFVQRITNCHGIIDRNFRNAVKVSGIVTSVSDSNHDQLIVDSEDLSLEMTKTYDLETGEDCISHFEREEFVGSNISIPVHNKNYGGGLRVKSISITDPLSDIEKSTEYSYNQPENPFKSSGVTSYEPNYLDVVNRGLIDIQQQKVRELAYEDFNDLLNYNRDIPGPGVLYEYVTVKESVTTDDLKVYLPNKSIYNFRVFKENMINVFENVVVQDYDYESAEDHDINVGSVIARETSIHDLSGVLGSLRSLNLYQVEHNDEGTEVNARLISNTENKFLYDEFENREDVAPIYNSRLAAINHQGVITRSTANAAFVEISPESHQYGLYGNIVKKISYPNIQLTQVNRNYISGGVSTTQDLAYDFYSGLPIESYSEDIYGNKFLTKNIPAYRLLNEKNGTAYPLMGLKSLDSNNKNMLVQEGASIIYKLSDQYLPALGNVPESEKESLISASIQLWENDNGKVLSPTGIVSQEYFIDNAGTYRKHGKVTYIGDNNENKDGTYPILNLEEISTLAIDGLQLSNISGWRKNGEATLYDVNSHVLEAKDINGNYAATKFDSEFEEVYSSATNAAYDEFAFSGAEDLVINDAFGGGVLPSDGIVIPDSRHTGQFALAVPANAKGFSFTVGQLTVDRTYKVSVWTNNPEATLIAHQINGLDQPASQLKVNAVGNWYQVSTQIKVPANTSDFEISVKTSGSNVILDDFMAFPVDAGITAYVYNEWGELSDVIDRNNLPTHYEYDAMGRLKSTWAESFQYGKTKISETNYHYANQD